MKVAGQIIAILAGVGILAVVMLGLAGGFSPKIAPGQRPLPEEGLPAATVYTVGTEEVPAIERASGTLRARSETSVSARITATVVTMNLRAGDSVREGDVIATLDDRDLRARVAQARDTVVAVRARLEEARSEFERQRELVASGVSAQAALDTAAASFNALRAESERAERSLEEAETNLSFATILAPINGRAIDRLVEPGDLVTPGRPIVRLYDPRSLRLEANVRETLATTLAYGDQLDVLIDATGERLAGTVDEIVPQSESGSRTFLVKVAIPPADNHYPGMFGRLFLPTGTETKLFIPRTAIREFGQITFVLVQEADGEVYRRFVLCGLEGDDDRLAIRSGLEPGEQILVPAP